MPSILRIRFFYNQSIDLIDTQLNYTTPAILFAVHPPEKMKYFWKLLQQFAGILTLPLALQSATSEKDAAYARRKAAQVSKQNIENKPAHAKSQDAEISAVSDMFERSIVIPAKAGIQMHHLQRDVFKSV